MDIRHLELLRELDERGSVTEVARVTHRTPSAISQQLRSAEKAFEARLVEPEGRGLRLTEAGRVLADAGRELSEAVAKVEARWEEFRGEPTGVVAVAALPSAATFLLPAVLRALADQPIDLVCADIDIAEHEFPALVRDHDIVVAHSLSGRVSGADDLVTVHLAREPLDIAMAPDHPLAAGESVRPRDVVRYPWIGVPEGFPFDMIRLAIERATGRRIDIRQRLRDNRLVEALVADTDHLAVLPRYTTPSCHGVTLRPLSGLSTGRHIFALLRPDRAHRRAVRRVLEEFTRAGAAAEH